MHRRILLWTGWQYKPLPYCTIRRRATNHFHRRCRFTSYCTEPQEPHRFSRRMNHIGYPTSSSRHEPDMDPRVMNQIIFEDLFKDKWQQCFWCWKWGMEVFGFLRPIGVGSMTYHDARDCYLCINCSDLAEPPWYPNARRRCAQSLKHIMPQSLRGNDEVLATMSAFVIGNDPWRCRSYTARVTPCCTLHCIIHCNF